VSAQTASQLTLSQAGPTPGLADQISLHVTMIADLLCMLPQYSYASDDQAAGTDSIEP
jgi:hypothetical protein